MKVYLTKWAFLRSKRIPGVEDGSLAKAGLSAFIAGRTKG